MGGAMSVPEGDWRGSRTVGGALRARRLPDADESKISGFEGLQEGEISLRVLRYLGIPQPFLEDFR